MSSLLNSGTSKLNIKWENLDGVKFPILVHKNETYIPVDVTNSAILSAFPSDPPEEIMTPLETFLLSSAQAQLFQNAGYVNIKAGDNIVNYSQFLTFYEKVKEHFPEHAKKLSENNDTAVSASSNSAVIDQSIVKTEIDTSVVKQEIIKEELAGNDKPKDENMILKSVTGSSKTVFLNDAGTNSEKDTATTTSNTGWLQINQTYLPFIFKYEKIFVPTKIVRKAARLKVPKTSVLLPEDDCNVLSEMCKVLNSENTNTINFDSKSKFSDIQIIRELNIEELKVLKYLPGNPVNCIQNNEGVAFDTFLNTFKQQQVTDTTNYDSSKLSFKSDSVDPDENRKVPSNQKNSNNENNNADEVEKNNSVKDVTAMQFKKIIVDGKKMICLKRSDTDTTFLPLEAVWRVFYQDVPLEGFIQGVKNVLHYKDMKEFCEISESNRRRLLELYGVTGVTLLSNVLLDETQLKLCWGPLKQIFADQERVVPVKRKNSGSDDFFIKKKQCV